MILSSNVLTVELAGLLFS